MLFFVFLMIFPLPTLITVGVNYFISQDGRLQIFGVVCLSLVIAVLAYFFLPTRNQDLSRYYNTMMQIKDWTLQDFFVLNGSNNALKYQNSLFFNFFEYLIARTGLFGLLPAITSFVTYFLLGYTFCRIKILYPDINKSVWIEGCITFFAIFSPGLVFNSIRWYTATAILFFVFFKVVFDNWRNSIFKLLLLFPVLIHSAILPISIIAIISLTTKKFSMSKLIILFLGVQFYFLVIAEILQKSNNGFLSHIGSMSIAYTENFMASGKNTNGWIVSWVNQILVVLLILIALYYLRKIDIYPRLNNIFYIFITIYIALFTFPLIQDRVAPFLAIFATLIIIWTTTQSLYIQGIRQLNPFLSMIFLVAPLALFFFTVKTYSLKYDTSLLKWIVGLFYYL